MVEEGIHWTQNERRSRYRDYDYVVNLRAAHFKGTENEEEKEGVENEKGDEDDGEEVVPTT